MTQSFPDGLSQRNLEARAWPSALSFILLACLMLAGLAGVLGGQPSTTKQVEGEAILKVTTPTVLRKGMFFERSLATARGRSRYWSVRSAVAGHNRQYHDPGCWRGKLQGWLSSLCFWRV